MIVLWYITLFVFVIYACLVLYFFIGVLRLPQYSTSLDKNVKVSVVVAMRNEEGNAVPLLKSLLSQDWQVYEVIIVDDYSTDNTWAVLQSFASDKVRVVRNTLPQGKKFALSVGIRQAQSDYILVTDADCLLPRSWIRGMAGAMIGTGAQLVLGNVMISYKRLLSWQALESLEFASLLASGLGSAGQGKPFMANGANIGFVRSLWQEANIHIDHPSGDDVFLLHEARRMGRKIIVQASMGATVWTKAQGSLRRFFNQRIRWASKAGQYTDHWAQAVAMVVFITNFLLLVWMAVGVRQFLVLYGIKAMVDFLLLWAYLGRYGHKKLLIWFLVEEILYIFYAVSIGVLSQFIGFEWKGRKYRK